MADNNPFNAALDPSQGGTLMGFLGQLTGSPSYSQYQGKATGNAQQAISQYMQSGMTPQQALVKFIGSPEGIDYFTAAGPNGMKQLQDFLQASTPPNPQAVGLKPGETGLIAQGGKILMGPVHNPTNEVQNFNTFANLAQLPQDRIKELAELQIDPTAKNTGAKERAIDKLVSDYGLDAQTGEKMKAGLIQVVPAKDSFGNTTGDVSLIDLSDPKNVKSVLVRPQAQHATDTPTNQTTVPPVGPGASPDTGAGTGVLPPSNGPSQPDPTKNQTYFGDKASMFLGAGIVPNALGAASKLSEQIDPSLIIPEGAKANDRATLIAQTRNSLISMGAGEGNTWGLNKATLKTFLDLVPTDGVTESPHASIQKGIRLLQKVHDEIASEEQTIASNDPNISSDVKRDASRRIEGWRRVERTLPSMGEMTRMEESIRNGTAGAPTVSSGVKAIADQAGKVLTAGKKQASEISNTLQGQQTNYSTMTPQELGTVDPRKLSRDQLIQYRNRIQELKAQRGKRTQP